MIKPFMKTYFIFFLLISFFSSKAQQTFCDEEKGAYGKEPIYSSSQIKSRDYKYATVHNVYGASNVSVDLYLTIYSPCDLPVSIDSFKFSAACSNCKRPFLMWIHGGTFRKGCKFPEADKCKFFAERGYVVGDINCRIGWV